MEVHDFYIFCAAESNILAMTTDTLFLNKKRYTDQIMVQCRLS
jgi:hypothetical protein